MTREPAPGKRRKAETAAQAVVSLFFPGQEVVCVDDSDTLVVDKGHRYFVKEIDRQMLVIWVMDDDSRMVPQHMWASRFRPA